MSEPLKDKFEADRASLAECARVVSRPAGIPVDGALAALRESMSGLAKLVNGNASRELYVSAMAAVECLAMAIEQAQAAERAAHPAHVVTSDPSIEARATAAFETWARSRSPDIRLEPLSEGGQRAWQAVVRAVDASRPGSPPTNDPADHWIAWRGSASDFVTDMKAAIPPAKLEFLKACLGAQDPEHDRVTMMPLDRLQVIAGLVQTLPHGAASHEVALGHDEPAFAMLCEAGATVTRNDLGDVGIILRAELRLDGVRFTAQRDGEGVLT